MARIRSIKPEFFESETIAALPVTARLTFIGLWTHVDDNGVCLDNTKLIKSAIWPLEEDQNAALEQTRSDLCYLHKAGLIVRYESADGRRLLFVTNWREHQKISHPRQPRYDEPTDEQVAASLTSADENLRNPPEDYRSAPEEFRPDQGSGIRDQGTPPDEPAIASARAKPKDGKIPSTHPKLSWTPTEIDADPQWQAFWEAYPKKANKGHARTTWLRILRDADDPAAMAETLTEAALRYRNWWKRDKDYTKDPGTWLNGECWNDELEAAPAELGEAGGWWNN